ncbi:MAG: ATP-binding cassette domain-containing protein [Proteobacteria bacterium]|nr:ATP-binding cassette domain-containing protein [Pseudomonadota bacterium]
MANSILSVSNLGAGYNGRNVVKGIDLDVFKGEIVGLVGPNGAGKTTLLETIAGINKSRSGTITWNNKSIDTLTVMARRKLGMILVPQEAYIFPLMTVQANLEVSGTLNKRMDSKKLIEYVFDVFSRLRDRTNQIANTLSGGERKMLAVAMGIVSNANLIVIDEPSIGLAPKMVTRLLENLKQITLDTGRTLLLAEQNTKILTIADRIYGLEAGEIKFCDRTENIDEATVLNLYMGE